MDFGQAIKALKDGCKVARSSWLLPDEEHYLAYMPAFTIPSGMVNGRTAKFVPPGIDVPCGDYIAKWTCAALPTPATADAPNGWRSCLWQPGWLASQADMLAEDWAVVE